MTTLLSVSAIKKGVVIDHIPPGQAVNIIRKLQLTDKKHTMTVGSNLSGKKAPFKDLIKIERRLLTDLEVQAIAVLAPGATISIIDDYKVISKMKVVLPENITGLFICPNANCITRTEIVPTFFYVNPLQETIRLNCRFCEKTFDREDIKEYCP